ncbi:MAG: SpoIIE family protein phosphatase [Flavobacteriales bacterium]|nr:SpoIIE family protein phosphatase [Flavobacteriales bacterium]
MPTTTHYNLLLAFLFLLTLNLGAQQYYFRNFSVDDGLSQSQVFDIHQDKRGYLWFGTQGGGVSIFDGADFKYIDESTGLSNNNVKCCYPDTKGSIWIGTYNGLNKFDGYSIQRAFQNRGHLSDISTIVEFNNKIWVGTANGLISFDQADTSIMGKEDGLLDFSISALYSDGNRLWVGYEKEGFSVITKDGEISHHLTKMDNPHVNAFFELDDSTMWVATQFGVFPFNMNSNVLSNEPFVVGDISNILGASNNTIWVTTRDNGVFKYSEYSSVHLSTQNGLGSDEIISICEDNEGNIWLGSNTNGVFQYLGEQFVTYGQNEGLTNEMVIGVQEDIYSNIWIGTTGGLFNLKDNQISEVPLTPGGKEFFGAILEDISGNVWFGEFQQGLFKYDGEQFEQYTTEDGLAVNSVSSIFQDSKGTIWIGGVGRNRESAISTFDGEAFQKRQEFQEIFDVRNFVSGISEDKNGNIWIGTATGIFRYNGKTIKKFGPKDGFDFQSITDLISDKDGNLWISSQGQLILYNGESFRSFSASNEFGVSNIYSMAFLNDSVMYLGSEKGLIKVWLGQNRSISTFKIYNSLDGFSGIECNTNALFKDKTNKIWVGTIKGLIHHNPTESHKVKAISSVFFEKIKLNYEDADWSLFSDSLAPWTLNPINPKFNSYDNHLTFVYKGLYLTNPKDVYYQIKLEGLDKKWSAPTKENKVTYSNLASGKYRLLVQSSKDLQNWSEPTAFKFTIKKAYWQTWWFMICSFVFIFSLTYLVISLRTNQLTKTKNLLEKKVRVRTRELLKQKQELETLTIAMRETADGVLIAAPDGNIEWMNDGLKRLTGYDLEEVKQHYGSSLLEVSSYDSIGEVMKEIERTKESIQYDSKHIHKNGHHVWTTATITPVFNKVGKLVKYVVIYTNISERKKAEEEIRSKNKNIMDNIRYAQRIQEAILPRTDFLKTVKQNSFNLLISKELVSGDFLWCKKVRDVLVFAAVDCTGHGVHAALMSMISNEYLHQVINYEKFLKPEEALQIIDEKVKKSLNQMNAKHQTNDGFDISLCFLDLNSNLLTYSGAYRPVIIIRNKEIIQLDPEKYSIGGHREIAKNFTSKFYQLQPGDRVYSFSDGIVDQFGGPMDKKFSMKRFKNLLIDIQNLSMQDQETAIKDAYLNWKVSTEQTDDILVIGIEI